MKSIKLVYISALIAAGSLLAAACGSDDDDLMSGTGGTSAGGGSGTGGGTSAGGAAASLTIDSNGWVARDTNEWGIQGAWYWYADYSDGKAGKTTLTGVTLEVAPYIAGQGMCLSGNTPGGSADNYVTWGAGIGLNLNQEVESDLTPVLNPSPRCFTITITSASAPGPGEFIAKLSADPAAATVEAPSAALKVGVNEVCKDNVKKPTWCGSSTTTTCAEPSSLDAGIAAIQIQANSGAAGGVIDFCITSIVPHN